MRYPEKLRVIVDVTKPPYCADNTGKTDCTEAINRAYNDIVLADIAAFRETFARLNNAPKDQNTYIGFQSRRIKDAVLNVSYAENLPPARILYFPKGTYLISDTIVYKTRDAKRYFNGKFYLEVNRNIHFEGESREETVIKLQDNAKGFEYGQIRPMISFINRSDSIIENVACNAMLNTFKDLTLDCGEGNPGAVGIKYYASNSGCISNTTIKSSDPAHEGFAGILMAGTVGTVRNVNIDGFDYGVLMLQGEREFYEDVTFENQRLHGIYSKHGSGVFRNIKNKTGVPTITMHDYTYTEASVMNVEGKVVIAGNFVYQREDDETTYSINLLHDKENRKSSLKLPISEPPVFEYPDTALWVCVDDYGACGDGGTDSTQAIQAAMNSGAEVIYFNEGRYVISDEIVIPASVKMINFCFCDMVAGEKLKNGHGMGAFVIAQDSEDTLFMENAFTWEKFCGFFRFVRHSAKRDVVLKDIHLQTACVYVNTVAGSNVYLDDVACTTGDFSEWYVYEREGEEPVYAANIPFEFHGQTVWARNVNPERADLEILNDGGKVVLMGVYVEGPGTIVKTVNGGQTEVLTFSAALGANNEKKPLFINEDSDVSVVSGKVKGGSTFSDKIKRVNKFRYPVIVEEIKEGDVKRIKFEELHLRNASLGFLSGYIGELRESRAKGTVVDFNGFIGENR